MLQTLLFSLVCMFLFVNGQPEVYKSSCEETDKSLAALDFAKEAISKAKELYPNCNDDNGTLNTTVCGKKEKSQGYLEIVVNLISEVKEHYPTCVPSKYKKPHQRPADCSEILQNGNNVSGVYTIWPRSRIAVHVPLDVYCDMETQGGGWTVIQRRGNFSEQEDFYRNWEDYKNGFGNLTSEFWIGNDNIFTLSNQGPYSIRFDMEDASGNSGFSYYQSFWIEDEMSNYKMHIADYIGEAGDGMTYNNGMKFTTKDRKNDLYGQYRWDFGPNCADFGQSGWWFKNCSQINPNGLYEPGINWFPETNVSKYMYWGAWKPYEGLAAMEMKLRTV